MFGARLRPRHRFERRELIAPFRPPIPFRLELLDCDVITLQAPRVKTGASRATGLDSHWGDEECVLAVSAKIGTREI